MRCKAREQVPLLSGSPPRVQRVRVGCMFRRWSEGQETGLLTRSGRHRDDCGCCAGSSGCGCTCTVLVVHTGCWGIRVSFPAWASDRNASCCRGVEVQEWFKKVGDIVRCSQLLCPI